jgi:6-phosphogluconolactonase
LAFPRNAGQNNHDSATGRVRVTESNQASHEAPVVSVRLARRDLFPLVGAAALAAFVAPAAANAEAQAAQQPQDDTQAVPSRYVYVGTYTAPNTAPGGQTPSTSKGIYAFKMDGTSGSLSPVQVFEVENPSWVCVDANATHLYATSEVTTWNGAADTGGITSFSIDSATGKITSLGDQATAGSIPAHVILDPSGKFALVANYVGATWSVLPVGGNGALGPASGVWAATGNGPNAARQEAPHPHETMFDPAGGFVFGPDLGTDHLWSWKLNTSGGLLMPNTYLGAAQVASGTGPRHMSFHPSGKFAYAIGEMVSSITAYRYDAEHGTLSWMQTVSTLPPDYTGESATAEIMVHPSGRFVYGSNRGHNTIAGFSIDQTTGLLNPIGWTSTQGEIPRGFNIDPSGGMMLVGNQNSDTVVPFRISPSTGRLIPTGAVTQTPVPVSFAFGGVTT